MTKEKEELNKLVVFLREKNIDKTRKELDDFVISALTKQKSEQPKSPQELTREYDNSYSRLIKDLVNNPNAVNFDFPKDCRETFYLCLTYCRRENLREKFVILYEQIREHDSNIFNDILLQSFRFYYIRYRYVLDNPGCSDSDYDLLTTVKKVNNEDNLLYLYSNSKSDICMISKITYAAFVYTILIAHKEMLEDPTSRYKEFYKKALNAISDMISDSHLNGYAWYYFIRASILMLGVELEIEPESRCDDIRIDIKKALKLENSTESGLRKKTEYLSLLSELNMHEVNKKIEDSETRMREVEKNSIKKFSAFCAFITFAVGLISKFINGGEIIFNEIVGYFFVLFGISVAIFMIFDLIVLGPLSISFNNIYHRGKIDQKVKKHERSTCIKFAIKALIEIAIVVTFIWLGCLIGAGTIKIGYYI